MELTLVLHFLEIALKSDVVDLAPLLRRLYRSNDLRPPGVSGQPDLAITVSKIEKPGPITEEANAAISTPVDLCGTRSSYKAGCYYSVAAEPLREVRYDVRRAEVQINVGDYYVGNPLVLIARILRPLLRGFPIAFLGMKTLHGALIARGDHCLHLMGPGGTGKSTTALAFQEQGYEILSDDSPYFTLRGETAFGLGSLDYLYVSRQTVGMFPHLRTRIVGEEDERGKFVIAQNGPLEAPRQRPRRVTHVIHLRRSEGVPEPRLVRVPKQTIASEMLRESMLVFPSHVYGEDASRFTSCSRYILSLISKLTEAAETYYLDYADLHLRDLPGVVEKALI